MEDEDFGFTKREESVLRKVLKDCEAKEEIGLLADENGKKLGDENKRSAGAEGTGRKKNVDDGGSVIPDESEGVSSHEVDGRNNSSADDEKRTPETGTEEANKRSSCQTETSVNRQTPNIPNVVEYHLKVQTQSSEPREDKSLDKQAENNETEKQSENKMRTETRTPLSSRSEKKTLSSKLSKLSIDNNVFEGSTELPQVFQVKYLGSHDARGLWGIKHTRKPVDNMVASAKSLPPDTILPLVKLVVSEDGVSLLPLGKRKFEAGISKTYPIESISYGVQDLVYTRVFSMIVVRDNGNFRRVSPFECHAFVCESKHHARQLTYGLAAAFQIYSQSVKTMGKANNETNEIVKKRFAIDLRSPEEIETDLNLDSEA
ncbi:uncharacterized protein [Venturia canescens]|nr:uncharacterized protein LOC122413458 isoform X2 [Venturia canescens]XP_043279748.1 uncharacterized protein LOC122413458 isoform X2 [Venturia canescens]XP_043279750.1 uncharacterized protein LOC122413458 isoform X2 [Venturia canescens]